MVKFIVGAVLVIVVISVLLTKGFVMFIEFLGANFITGNFVIQTFFVVFVIASITAMVIGLRIKPKS